RRAALARRMAMFVAKSPCWVSFVRSTTTMPAEGASGSRPAGRWFRGASTSCSSCCFKGVGSDDGRRRSLPEPAAPDLAALIRPRGSLLAAPERGFALRRSRRHASCRNGLVGLHRRLLLRPALCPAQRNVVRHL